MTQYLGCEEEIPPHYYRTEIPNCIFHADLNPYQFYVYAYLKKMAGDNNCCFQRQKKIAEECKMSEKKLRLCLEKLCEINPVLGVPLIRKKQRKKDDGSLDTCIYIMVNVWHLNSKFYSEKKEIKNISGSVPDGGGVRYGVPKGFGTRYR